MLVSTVCKLIEFKTEKDNLLEMKRLVNYLKDLSLQHGWIMKTYSFNKIPSISIRLGNYQPKIILNGHLDIVSAKPEQFIPKVVGNRIYGRGTLDMKASFAVYLEIFKELSRTKSELPVEIVGVFDEEIGGFSGSKEILKLSKPDYVVIGEPTNMQLETESKGVIWAKIKTLGKSAHAAKPWEGNNAIEKLCVELINLKKRFSNKESPWQTTFNIGKIQGGVSINQLPSSAEATIDIRRIADDSPAELIKIIEANFVYKDTQIEVLVNEPVHDYPKNNKYTKKLVDVISKYQKLTMTKSFFASDARHYSSSGIPAIVFGPTGKDMHGPNEHVNISSLLKYKEILKEFIITSI